MKNSKALQQGGQTPTAFYRLMFSKYCFKPNDAQKITLHFIRTSAANTPKIEEVKKMFWADQEVLNLFFKKLTMKVNK